MITICRLTNGKDYLGAFAGKLFVFFLVGGGKNMMKDDGNDWHNAGQGMRMTMVDSKPTQRHVIKANVIARIDLSRYGQAQKTVYYRAGLEKSCQSGLDAALADLGVRRSGYHPRRWYRYQLSNLQFRNQVNHAKLSGL